MSEQCPIAYDHNDYIDECAVCGWTGITKKRKSHLADIPRWLWPENADAPAFPVTLCGPGCNDD